MHYLIGDFPLRSVPTKEVRDLPVPSNGWINGGWNKKLPQFRLLAEMLGLNKPSISPDELQELFKRVGSAKVFADNVQPFLDESGLPRDEVFKRLEKIEASLGLLQLLPFMSLKGLSDPHDFGGVAIWPAGITNWCVMRHDEIVKAHKHGANFERVIVMWSSRKCDASADRRHPYIRDFYEEGDEPTERQLMQDIVNRDGVANLKYEFATLPKAQANGSPLPLQHQLENIVQGGQFDDYLPGRLYVPSTPNSLYVPLHVMRVLGLDNVWFSQAGSRPVREMPGFPWPGLQEILTTPNGIIRLWVELLHSGCINAS